MIVVLFLDMLPARYVAMIALILFFLWCVTLNSQVARRKRGTIGKVFSLLVVCFLSIGTYYIAKMCIRDRQDIDAIEVPGDVLNIDGAAENVVQSVDITPYLPEGTMLEEGSTAVSYTPLYVKASPNEIQVMTPTRKGLLGVERLNGILQRLSLIHI